MKNIALPASARNFVACMAPANLFAKIKNCYSDNPAEFWHGLLFASFWLSIALFPIGYGFREVMPPICFIFLLLWYRHAWHESVLARLKQKWLFYCAAIMILIGVIFSIHPWQSVLHAGMGINKAYILPFIAMECVRDERELKRLIWACVFACFWEGLDGVWQAHSGRDFIMGYELHAGRLTGSLGDYAVGNYLALAMIPAFGLWFILRQHNLSRCASLFISVAIFWPSVFLLIGASSRSAFLAVAGAFLLWGILRYGKKFWKIVPLAILPFVILAIVKADRLSLVRAAGDDRWDLWHLAIRVFCEHPWFGAGAGQYNTAFREMGLAPVHEVITISHPHDLYIDILYAHGIVGFALGMIFIFGFLIWGWRQIRKGLSNEKNSLYWQMAAFFLLGYAGWLINGIFGHDFYRIWWLAEAMTWLGIMIGAVVNGMAATETA